MLPLPPFSVLACLRCGSPAIVSACDGFSVAAARLLRSHCVKTHNRVRVRVRVCVCVRVRVRVCV